MSLRINLKAKEKIIIGKTLIVNGDAKSSFTIEGENVPILRERFILAEKDVKTPVQRIYFLVQLMYVSDDPAPYTRDFFQFLNQVMKAAPSLGPHLLQATEKIRVDDYYNALRDLQSVLEAESEILKSTHADTTIEE